MPKAGMFAGEVTPLAPADEAPTDKAKSYVWMEYGETAASGICGTTDDLTQGQLLNVGSLESPVTLTRIVTQNDPGTDGVSFDNTAVISLTAAIMRQAAPDPGLFSPVMAIINTTTGNLHFGFHLDSNGYMILIGRNAAGTIILDVTITKNGGSFADSELHIFGIVVDLSSTARREIYHNNVDITADAAWVTWATYTDDIFQLFDAVGSTVPRMQYVFGGDQNSSWGTGSTYNGNELQDYDVIGYVTFDDTCSLICSSLWDVNGWLRDPQGDGTGWYKTQPQVAFLPSFWKNSGKTAPATYQANSMELDWSVGYSNTSSAGGNMESNMENEKAIINLGIGGTTEAI